MTLQVYPGIIKFLLIYICNQIHAVLNHTKLTHWGSVVLSLPLLTWRENNTLITYLRSNRSLIHLFFE